LLGRTTFQAPTPGVWMVSSIKLLREASDHVHGMHPWSFLGRRKEAASGSSGPLLLTSADAGRSTEDKAAIGGALVPVAGSNSNASDAQQVGAMLHFSWSWHSRSFRPLFTQARPAAGSQALALRQQPKVPRPQWHANWELSAVISGHLGWVRSLAFDPSNEWFATGSVDRTIKVP
jgi:WD40 repeat protein